MPVRYEYCEFEIERNLNKCICCRVCERQCSGGVHRFDKEAGVMLADDENA